MEYTRIIIRHDTTENWVAANPILEEGEYGHDMTLNRFKVGDGYTDWRRLQWSSTSYSDFIALNTSVTEHIENGAIHVTQAEKNTWNAKSDFSGSYNDLTNKPNLSTVATTGNYNDLTNKPTIPSVGDGTITIKQGETVKGSFTTNQNGDTTITLDDAGASDWSEIENKPDFATVATSGSYNDLTNKPTIPTSTSDLTNNSNFVSDANYVHTDNNFTNSEKTKLSEIASGAEVNVQSDWENDNQSSDAYIRNKPSLAAVATSGAYSDLSGKPSLAAVATSGDYDDLSNTPTKLSDFTNDTGYVSGTQLSDVATSGSYNDLTDKPTIPTVGNGTVTINQGGELKGTFTMNQSGDTTINLGQGIASVGWDDVTGKPDFADVATSGSYNDLSDTPTIPAAQVNSDWDAVSGVAQILHKPALSAVATSGQYSDLSGTPNLATVAETGSYNDLSNKPSIPSNTSDLNNDSGFITGVDWDDVADKPTFATVATTGDYGDLNNTPSIPTVNNATLTINQGGALKGTFTANASQDVTIDLGEGLSSVDWDDVTNKPTFANVATSGSYTDLSDKPSIPAAQVNSDWNAVSGVSQILNKPNLATVATSGSYNDLSNKPSIPAAQVQADWNESDSSSMAYIQNKPTIPYVPTVGNGTITIVQGSTTKGTFSVNQTGNTTVTLDASTSLDWDDVQNKPTFATVATSGSYNDLSNKPTILDSGDFKTINSNTIVGSGNISIKPFQQNTITNVSATSLAVNENTVYTFGTNPTQLTLSTIPNSQYESNIYFTAGGNFTLGIPNGTVVYGSASIVSGEHYSIAIKDGKVVIAHDGETGVSVAWADVTGKPNFATVATSGSYNDLSNKPTIPTVPTNVSAFTNDAGYITGVDWDDVADKPTFATVATSGSYDDLDDKPTIPTVNNATLTITQGGVSKGTFTANASQNVTIALDAGGGGGSTDWDDITNKPTFATVATSGSYTDLSNKPTIPTVPTNVSAFTNDAGYVESTDLASVATSGSYNDLSDKPTIPSAQVNSDWNSASGVSQILNKPTMQTYQVTFTLEDDSTVTKTFWVES